MHIERLEIRGFGKLSGLDLRFVKGLNLVYGRNESGKSTLQAFIKAMLYGLKSGKPARDGLPAPLKRFRPWGGGSYGGVMGFRLENGLSFRVERDFECNTARIYDEHFNNITADYVSGKDKSLLFAEKHIGMNEACFDRTVFVKQMETSLGQDDAGVLSNRLANASETGYEDISFKKADKALRDALISYVGTDRSSVRPIDRLNARLEELDAARSSLKAAGMEFLHAHTDLQAAKKAGEELLSRKDFLGKVRKLVELRRLLDGRMAAESAIKDSARRIQELEAKLDGLMKSGGYSGAAGKAPLLPRPGDLPLPAVLTAAAVLAVFIGRDFAPYVYGVAVLLLAAAAIRLASSVLRGGGRRNIKNGNAHAAKPEEKLSQIIQLKDRQKELYSKVSAACGIRIGSMSELREAAAEAAKSVAKYETALAEGLRTVSEGCGSRPADPFDCKRLEEIIYDSSLEWLDSTLSRESELVDRTFNDNALKIRELETLLRNSLNDDEALQRIDEEEAALKERKAELEKTGAALKLAHEVLTEAGAEVRRSLTPALESRMSAIAGRMTGGKYTDLRVDDGLALKTVPPETGDVRAAGLLSGGTADQMYLALRLAMADVLSPDGENLPVFLDEVFSQYDDIRTGQAIEFLFEEYSERQALLFTCKEREAAIAREICGSRLNLLML